MLGQLDYVINCVIRKTKVILYQRSFKSMCLWCELTSYFIFLFVTQQKCWEEIGSKHNLQSHTNNHWEQKCKENKQDTRGFYTGSPKDGYFLFLPLQFYYDDEEITRLIHQLSLFLSLNIASFSNLTKVFSQFFSLKKWYSISDSCLKTNPFIVTRKP